MARIKQTTIDGLALPVSAGGGMPMGEAPAFRLPVWRSLKMHPVLALSVALAVLAALLGFALTRRPIYRAESRVYVEPIPTRVLGDSGVGNYDLARYESFLQEQMETVSNPNTLLAAVESMPAGVWQRPGETAQAAAGRLAAALKTERVSTSYQLAISVGASSPEAAAAAANAVTRAYLAAGRKDAGALSAGRLQLLTEERQRIADEMQARRAEQNSLGASLGVANPNGAGADAYDTELQTVRGELASARQAHDLAAAQLAALSGPGGQRAAGTVATAEEAVATDPAVSSMRIAINQRRATLIAQMNGMKPANPVYQDDTAELARLDAQLAGMSSGLQAQVEQRMESKLRQDLQRTGDVESRLNAEVSRDTALATSAGPKLQRSAELTADLLRLQTRYAAVDDAVRGLQLEANGPGMAHLVAAASVPGGPEPSKSRIVLPLALPFALLMGLLAALLAQKTDDRIYTANDVEEALGFAPVGVLPLPSEVSDPVTEEYLLRLAAGLESAYHGASARSFVFTSASPDTDVTSEVEAMRRKLVELGFTAVVLAAGQVMRPNGEAMAAAGEREGFASARLEELKTRFDLVLIDAHPLLHSGEAEYAVRSADAVILVIESGVTTGRELTLAAALLRRLQASGVGTLLQGLSLRNGEPEFRKSIAVLERRELSGTVRRTEAHAERLSGETVVQRSETGRETAAAAEPEGVEAQAERSEARDEVLESAAQESALEEHVEAEPAARPVTSLADLIAPQAEIDATDAITAQHMTEKQSGSAAPEAADVAETSEALPATELPDGRAGFPLLSETEVDRADGLRQVSEETSVESWPDRMLPEVEQTAEPSVFARFLASFPQDTAHRTTVIPDRASGPIAPDTSPEQPEAAVQQDGEADGRQRDAFLGPEVGTGAGEGAAELLADSNDFTQVLAPETTPARVETGSEAANLPVTDKTGSEAAILPTPDVTDSGADVGGLDREPAPAEPVVGDPSVGGVIAKVDDAPIAPTRFADFNEDEVAPIAALRRLQPVPTRMEPEPAEAALDREPEAGVYRMVRSAASPKTWATSTGEMLVLRKPERRATDVARQEVPVRRRDGLQISPAATSPQVPKASKAPKGWHVQDEVLSGAAGTADAASGVTGPERRQPVRETSGGNRQWTVFDRLARDAEEDERPKARSGSRSGQRG